MSRPRVNFMALMRNDLGAVVPGSRRFGHNVMTEAGRDILTRLVVWSSFGNPDVAVTGLRARWIGVGDGTQPEVEDVIRLASPIPYTGSLYLKPLSPALTFFPTLTSVALKIVFGPSEISLLGPTTVSEAGLYFDAKVSGSTTLSDSSANNIPAFYKTFEPMVKLSTFSMEILWEFRF